MIYDLEYFEKILRKNSATAEKIHKIRWGFIEEVNPQFVLDYGCGVGWFRAYRPKGLWVDSYDICERFPQTGIGHPVYDVICFWDVLEHIPDLAIVADLIRQSRFVAISLPIKPAGVRWQDWKHFRPLEHLHYYDLEELDAMFEFFGFKKIKTGQPECPPREDVWDILYKKNAE